jgi:hypothetical protein
MRRGKRRHQLMLFGTARLRYAGLVAAEHGVTSLPHQNV